MACAIPTSFVPGCVPTFLSTAQGRQRLLIAEDRVAFPRDFQLQWRNVLSALADFDVEIAAAANHTATPPPKDDASDSSAAVARSKSIAAAYGTPKTAAPSPTPSKAPTPPPEPFRWDAFAGIVADCAGRARDPTAADDDSGSDGDAGTVCNDASGVSGARVNE